MRAIARLYNQDGNSLTFVTDDDGNGAIHRYTSEGPEIEVSGSHDDVLEYFVDLLREARLAPLRELFDEAPEVPCGCDNCVCDDFPVVFDDADETE